MKSLLKGTFFLMLVILFSKCLSFFFRVQLMRIAGEEIVALYMTSYPAFAFFVALTQLGIPIAVAKLVASFQHSTCINILIRSLKRA